jgi:predicted extracellular nuclease
MSKSRRFIAYLVLAGLILGSLGSVLPVEARQDNDCGDPATPIHVIQGSGERTPEGGNAHTVEGVVTADLQDRITQFSGFFMQEEDGEADGDPLTSEGIFVDSSLSNVDVQAGDVVRVTGTAFELASDDGANLTQLRRIKALVVCSSGASVTPTAITLPVESLTDWERWEGMLVTFPQALTAGDLYNLGRYGEIRLSADGRVFQSTEIALPGAAALEVQAGNDRRMILLDDGNNQQNIDPMIFPAGGLSTTHLLRAGDTVTGLTGVLDQRFAGYRIQPTGPVEFTAANPRPAAPPEVGGRLRVVSFNVLNYFNGDGAGGGFPTARGASTPEELERQRAKTVSAILALNPDIIAIMEIENDGDGPESAAADLVNSLNAAAGGSVYAYIPDPAGMKAPSPDPDDEQGGDQIKQTILYKTAAVQPVGDPVLTLDPPFDIRRPPVAQAFEEVATGERLIVVANHLKSKGCTDVKGSANADQGDGQGCWNLERTQGVTALLTWLATDPTGTGDPDVLLLGDLNAYSQEDPLRLLEEGGYVNLTTQTGDYSYLYTGLAGALDHALASPTLHSQVTGAGVWHINADEPRVLDYNEEYKTAGQITGLYDPGPYRSADHDPLLVGLALGESSPTASSPRHDASGGTAAIAAGLVAVLIAMIGGRIVEAKRQRQ